MLLPDPWPPLRVTLLAGPNRALRGTVLEQLIANISPQPLTVLSFDHERRPIVRNSRVHFRWAEPKQILIAQPGLVVPFRADLFIELQAQDACMDACRNFDASLLSDEEVELGPRLWRSFVDPFKEG